MISRRRVRNSTFIRTVGSLISSIIFWFFLCLEAIENWATDVASLLRAYDMEIECIDGLVNRLWPPRFTIVRRALDASRLPSSSLGTSSLGNVRMLASLLKTRPAGGPFPVIMSSTGVSIVILLLCMVFTLVLDGGFKVFKVMLEGWLVLYI